MSLEAQFLALFDSQDGLKRFKSGEDKKSYKPPKTKCSKRMFNMLNYFYNYPSARKKLEDDTNSKSDKSSWYKEITATSPPFVELNCNPSAFAVYAIVRNTVIENRLKCSASEFYENMLAPEINESFCSDIRSKNVALVKVGLITCTRLIII